MRIFISVHAYLLNKILAMNFNFRRQEIPSKSTMQTPSRERNSKRQSVRNDISTDSHTDDFLDSTSDLYKNKDYTQFIRINLMR